MCIRDRSQPVAYGADALLTPIFVNNLLEGWNDGTYPLMVPYDSAGHMITLTMDHLTHFKTLYVIGSNNREVYYKFSRS